MSFSYAGTLATDLDKVRFYISDKVKDGGPRPGDNNFTNEEITGALALADSWEECVGNMFDTLAGEWIRYPSFQADNFAISRSHIAKNYQAQSELWRKQHGLASPQYMYGAPGSESITRVDAYSNDKDSVTE